MSLTPAQNGFLKPCVVLLEPLTPRPNSEFSAELKKAINERNILTSKTKKRVTEALEKIESESLEDTRKTKKQKILAEILESEEKYVRQLEIISEFFITPVKQRNLLEPHDFDALFGHFDTIYSINKELLEELRKGPYNVAHAFSKIAPLFKTYSFYAFEFKKSLEILQNCHKDNPKFEKFLEMQESRPEVQSKLSALLIAPIQRVPRYKLLLKPLFNITSPSELDYQCLLDSLQKVENAAEHINKIIEDRENMQRLIELQRCLGPGEPNLIAPGRNLIKEGLLNQITAKDGHSQKIHLVLTNDVVVFCKTRQQRMRTKSLKCSGIFPLNKCRILELLDKGAFKLMCQNEELVLYHESVSETKVWIQEIVKAISTMIEDRRTLKKENTVRRPVKRKDLSEYNETGLSPGKKLRKKKNPLEDMNGFAKPLRLSKRKAIRDTSNIPDSSKGVTPSFLVTLKPKGQEPGKKQSSSTDVFVFGKPQPDRGFSFKVNNFMCGIGTSLKKMFGFKK